MRVLLLNPPVPGRGFTNRDLMGGMGIDDDFGTTLPSQYLAFAKYQGIHIPVLALGYAAAILRRAGHSVVVLDQARQDPNEAGVLQAAVDARPDWVIAATSLAYFGAELDYLEQLRAHTGCQRMLVGTTAAHFAAELGERRACEAIALGDPEVAFEHLARGTLKPGVAGAAVRDPHAADAPLVMGQPVFLGDIDKVPMPDWTGFPLDRYRYHPLLRGRGVATMLASRGCPYACNFCPYPVGQGAPFRPRAVAAVVDEMTALVRDHGVRNILFRDPTFTLDMGRAKTLCRAIAAAKLPVQWGIETRLDRLDDELVDLLAAAGCAFVTVGLDPVDPNTRRASHRKGYGEDHAKAMLERLRRRKVASAGLFVVGLPDQTEEELRAGFAWIESTALTYVAYHQATVFPGTALYREALAKGWFAPLTLADLMRGEPKLSFNGRIAAARIRELQDEALRRFYRHPKRALAEVTRGETAQSLAFYGETAARFLLQRLAAEFS